ncbi:diacylglycerol kinase family protein [Pelosinus sp. sgz500959]|uniref:diacylglycerol kinase family protein n=1 Tax=Pelosinus sp. sgz500959 TaxID=3242472 RepID=UPI00366C5DD2
MKRKQSLSQAFKNAFSGIVYCLLHERNMKIHMAAAFFAGGLAWWLQLDDDKILVLLVTISSVLVAEMVNTVVEKVVDMVSPEVHPLAKIAKDVAAGAVLITAIISLIVGYILFWKKIWT